MPAFGAAGSDSARARLLLTRARRQRLGRRRTLVFDKEDEYLRGFGFARVARNRVDIARQLVEGVALDERHFLPSLDLHHDRARARRRIRWRCDDAAAMHLRARIRP